MRLFVTIDDPHHVYESCTFADTLLIPHQDILELQRLIPSFRLAIQALHASEIRARLPHAVALTLDSDKSGISEELYEVLSTAFKDTPWILLDEVKDVLHRDDDVDRIELAVFENGFRFLLTPLHTRTVMRSMLIHWQEWTDKFQPALSHATQTP